MDEREEILKELRLLREAIDDREDQLLDKEDMNKLRRFLAENFTEKLEALHDSLLVPPSSQEHDLLSEIREVVRAYKGASWLLKKLLWIIPAFALFLTSGEQLLASLKQFLGGSK